MKQRPCEECGETTTNAKTSVNTGTDITTTMDKLLCDKCKRKGKKYCFICNESLGFEDEEFNECSKCYVEIMFFVSNPRNNKKYKKCKLCGEKNDSCGPFNEIDCEICTKCVEIIEEKVKNYRLSIGAQE